jgi:hypothetical protein
MDNIERFDLDRGVRLMIHFSFWVLIFFVLLSLSLPFTARDGKPHNPVFIAWLSFFGTAFFGMLALCSWRYIRELPYTSVSLDEYGIWKTANKRATTLVPWTAIANLRERPYLQRLDLLDKSGQLLLKVEYQLRNFERLRTLLIERSALASVRTSAGQIFSKTIFHHVFTLVITVCFTALCIYLWPIKPVLSGITFLVVISAISWEYLTTVFKIELLTDELKIYTPLQKLVLNRSDIVSLDFSDLLQSQTRYPQVLVTHKKSKKSIVLRGLSTSTFELKRTLEAWHKN